MYKREQRLGLHNDPLMETLMMILSFHCLDFHNAQLVGLQLATFRVYCLDIHLDQEV